MAVEPSRNRNGIFGGVVYDLKHLHESWMELVYPRQRSTDHTVLGKWTPRTRRGWAGYRLWAAIGLAIVLVLYPLGLLGLALRFHTRRIDSTATRLGLAGVMLLTLVVWGVLTVVARVQFSTEGFLAVLAAGVVATLSAGVAVLARQFGGRATTVAVAYPAGMTTFFLPPVVAALYSPTIASVVFPQSTSLARWILDTFLAVGGLNEVLRSWWDLEGTAYVGMWLAISVPLGWLLGTLVSISGLARPGR